MGKFLIKYKNQIGRLATGLALGAALGYAWYFFIGCKSGSCAITGNPVNSSVYGALFGGIWALPNGRKSNKLTHSDRTEEGQETKEEASI